MIPYCEQLKGKFGYSDRSMMPPPSETGSNVVQFQYTTGCSHNLCTFCDMYKDENFTVKGIPEYKKHVDFVLRKISPWWQKSNLTRIFIGSGNVLSVETEELNEVIQYSLWSFREKIGKNPERLALYGNTMDILNHDYDGMHFLNCGGTCHRGCSVNKFGTRLGLGVVYWGLESGCDAVLKITGKGYSGEQAVDAGNCLGNVDASVMIMPGLGGMTFFNEHIKDTIEVLNEIEPKWITFMGLQVKENTPYSKWINEQEKHNKNRNLCDEEKVEQIAQIIEGLWFETTIGIHGDNIHNGFCKNPVSLGSIKSYDRIDGRQIARRLRRMM